MIPRVGGCPTTQTLACTKRVASERRRRNSLSQQTEDAGKVLGPSAEQGGRESRAEPACLIDREESFAPDVSISNSRWQDLGILKGPTIRSMNLTKPQNAKASSCITA